VCLQHIDHFHLYEYVIKCLEDLSLQIGVRLALHKTPFGLSVIVLFLGVDGVLACKCKIGGVTRSLAEWVKCDDFDLRQLSTYFCTAKKAAKAEKNRARSAKLASSRKKKSAAQGDEGAPVDENTTTPVKRNAK